MKTTHKRALAFIVGAIVPCIAAWLLGYDFDHRGPEALFTFSIALMCGVFGASFPFSEDMK